MKSLNFNLPDGRKASAKIGDQLVFRSPTRDNCRKATRPIVAFTDLGKPWGMAIRVSKYNGWEGFLVKLNEVIEVIPSPADNEVREPSGSVATQEEPPYSLTARLTRYGPNADERIISTALSIIERRLQRVKAMSSSEDTKRYLSLRYGLMEREVFGALMLDNQHGLIDITELFKGTIDAASVYPREVVKEVLRLNAAAVIFFHNHPSGIPEPSRADEAITTKLRDALALIDVRVLDHIVVGGKDTVSFAERGML